MGETVTAMQDSANSRISQRNIVQQHVDTASHLFPSN